MNRSTADKYLKVCPCPSRMAGGCEVCVFLNFKAKLPILQILH